MLIVEDDYRIALGLQLTLERHQWLVSGPAASVASARRLLTARPPDEGLLDVNLGRELVTPVAKRLMEANVPFAVASAYHRPEEIAGDAAGGMPNVGKPAAERLRLRVLEELAGGA